MSFKQSGSKGSFLGAVRTGRCAASVLNHPARKIHFDEAEPRNIYGNATKEEVTDLKEDGIDFNPLPDLPEDKN